MVRSAVAEAEYRPTENEPFMNPRQRDYFRKKLETWKEDILRESRETLENLQVIGRVATMPVFRPLIGMDKEEIMAEARALGTFPISIDG